MSKGKKFSSFGEQQSLAEGFRNYLAEDWWTDIPKSGWGKAVTSDYDETDQAEDQAEAEKFTDDQLKTMLAGEYKRKGISPNQWKTELDKMSSEELLAARGEQKKSFPGRAKKHTAAGEKKAKNKKRNRTLEAYKDMATMLAAKGHTVPADPKGRRKYINDILAMGGKSFKNGDWKNYAQMSKVLASVADKSQAYKDKASKAQAQSKKGKWAGVPSKRGGQAVDPKRAAQISKGKTIAARNEPIKKKPTKLGKFAKGVGGAVGQGVDAFKGLFKESEYTKLIEMITEELMKDPHYKELYLKSSKESKE